MSDSANPWTIARQAPPSMGFSRQEYWNGLPFPSPGDLSDPGIEPRSPALQADALTSEPPGKPLTSLKTDLPDLAGCLCQYISLSKEHSLSTSRVSRSHFCTTGKYFEVIIFLYPEDLESRLYFYFCVSYQGHLWFRSSGPCEPTGPPRDSDLEEAECLGWVPFCYL